MKKNPHTGNPCPSQPDLSAWTDLQNNPNIEKHVNECAKCSAKVEDYRTIDRAIEKIICPPADLVERIKDSYRKSEDPGILSGWPFPPRKILKYAAVFAVAGLAGWLATISVQQNKNPTGRPFARVSPEAGEQLSVNTAPGTDRDRRNTDLAENPLEKSESTPVESPSPGGTPGSTISPEDLAMADTSGTSGNRGASGFDSSLRKIVQRRVKHVWAVEDPEKILEFINRNLPAKVVHGSEIIRSTDKVILKLLIGDNQLQDLVDRIQGEDCSLISSDLPQPGGSRETFFTGNTVLYEADLVSRK